MAGDDLLQKNTHGDQDLDPTSCARYRRLGQRQGHLLPTILHKCVWRTGLEAPSDRLILPTWLQPTSAVSYAVTKTTGILDFGARYLGMYA
jgi:hypothetical protein